MSVLLITDQHDRQLRVLKPFSESGVISVGSPAPLAAPGGLAVDGEGNVIIADRTNHRLAIWDLWTGLWRTFGLSGSGEGQFSSPAAVATDLHDRIYVADAGNGRIVRMDDLTGTAWTAFGAPGGPSAAEPVAEGLFRAPSGIAVDGRGRVVITDPGAGRAVRIDDLDGSGWAVLPLPAGTGRSRPLGVAAGPAWIAVSDVGHRAVHVFDHDDGLLASLDAVAAGLPVPAYLAAAGDDLVLADIVANELRRYRLDDGTLLLGDIVRGSSPALVRPLFQELGGIASGGR